ncbi:hypothetical protein PV328_007464 [Microctonus aethiopoides]|uniref:ENTH domain-containing protein n=1 Tax=Microctonus aethiopoides TaxID=144406 RepID=A0AA39C8S4_9HYME|nr:hypothetical protein PV328_007464 [Microctonus aethiopoides]
MWKVRELMDKATNVVMNYTDTEAKVREATNDDAWGPTGAMMQELAQATFTYELFPEVMSMLWKRMLQENKRNWRRTYKSLLLLNYLVRNGSERVVTSSREHIYDLRSLENYTYIDEIGKDQGINVRHKVRELIDFIQDDDKLRDERKKAKKNKDKYVGMSSGAMGMNFGNGNSGDRWSDNPKWQKNKSSDNYNDWERNTHGSSGGFNDGNNSDDGEREDSDNDNNHYQSCQQQSKKVIDKDIRESMDTLDKIRKFTVAAASSGNNSPTHAKVIKKVDLGAAANYGKDLNTTGKSSNDLIHDNLMQSPIKQQTIVKSKNDILNDLFESQYDNDKHLNIDNDDDFNPRSDNDNIKQQSDNINVNFGDFNNAFGDNKIKVDNNDEFADFTSAFNTAVTINNDNNWPVTSQSTNFMDYQLGSNKIGDAGNNTDLFMTNSPIAITNLINDSGMRLSNQSTMAIKNTNNNSGMSTDLLTDIDAFGASSVNYFSSNSGKPDSGAILMSDTGFLSPTPINQRTSEATSETTPIQVGSTWAEAGLKIDLDNLLGNKSKQTGPAPSMNQLATTSPQHQRSIAPTMRKQQPMMQQQPSSPTFFPNFP